MAHFALGNYIYMDHCSWTILRSIFLLHILQNVHFD